MKILLSPVAMIWFAAIIFLHIIFALVKGKAATAVNLLNIILHVGFIVILAMSGCSTEEGALLYMISLFVYVALSAVRYKLTKKGKEASSVSEEPQLPPEPDTDICEDPCVEEPDADLQESREPPESCEDADTEIFFTEGEEDGFV
jgi:hypothetical protein